MSLNRLLSFVPLVGKHTAPGAFMISLSFNLLTAVWGLILMLSMAALFVLAFLTPKVGFFSSVSARDAEIQSIQSVTDIGLLQQKAILDVSQGYASSATATLLCHVALGTLLLIIVTSVGGLMVVRWMKRHLRTGDEELD